MQLYVSLEKILDMPLMFDLSRIWRGYSHRPFYYIVHLSLCIVHPLSKRYIIFGGSLNRTASDLMPLLTIWVTCSSLLPSTWMKLPRPGVCVCVKLHTCARWWEIIAFVQVCVFVCMHVYQAVEDRGIHAGKVNCDVHQRLCQEAQVNAYPSVRFYAGASKTRQTQVSTRSMQVLITITVKASLYSTLLWNLCCKYFWWTKTSSDYVWSCFCQQQGLLHSQAVNFTNWGTGYRESSTTIHNEPVAWYDQESS